MFDGIEEESYELKKVEALLFDFVDFVDGLDFVFVQESDQVGESVFLDERGAIGLLEVDYVFD